MKLLAEQKVMYKDESRLVQLYHGDLTAVPSNVIVEVLVVSAGPFNYSPVPHSLIGALHEHGLSIASLVNDGGIAYDWRDTLNCWLSTPIDPLLGLNIQRVLVFEPRHNQLDSELVGDIFRALMPYLSSNDELKTIAMPLLATGRRRGDMVAILDALLNAAVHWLALGLPVSRLLIVENRLEKAYMASGMFQVLQRSYQDFQLQQANTFRYDVFISYSTRNTAVMEQLLSALYDQQPDLRVFVDRQELNAGAAWQQEIYDALESCQKVVCLLSPEYLASKICLEEFNIALFRHRDAEPEGVLLPIAIADADLPIYMRLMQHLDCREGAPEQIMAAASEIIVSLRG